MHLFRVVSNYEYAETSNLPLHIIQENVRQLELELSTNLFGKLIKRIWGEKVVYQNRTSSYANLKLRVENCKKRHIQVNELDVDAVNEIQSLCHERGWLLDQSQIDKNIVSLIKLADPTSDEVIVNGQRLAFTIIISMDPHPRINLRSYGHIVPLEEIKGMHESECSIQAIEEAMFLCEFAPPCIGRDIPNYESTSYKVPVGGSNVISVTSKECGRHTRLVASSCLLVNPLGKSCSSCVYMMALLKNRDIKRKASNPICTPPKKCNIRFLDRNGLEGKIASQRKELRNDVKKDTRNAKYSATLEFMEDDSLDLARIVQGINSDDVPSSMKLIWEMQKKQLLAKSSRGHRWDPRYNFRYQILKLNVTIN